MSEEVQGVSRELRRLQQKRRRAAAAASRAGLQPFQADVAVAIYLSGEGVNPAVAFVRHHSPLALDEAGAQRAIEDLFLRAPDAFVNACVQGAEGAVGRVVQAALGWIAESKAADWITQQNEEKSLLPAQHRAYEQLQLYRRNLQLPALAHSSDASRRRFFRGFRKRWQMKRVRGQGHDEPPKEEVAAKAWVFHSTARWKGASLQIPLESKHRVEPTIAWCKICISDLFPVPETVSLCGSHFGTILITAHCVSTFGSIFRPGIWGRHFTHFCAGRSGTGLRALDPVREAGFGEDSGHGQFGRNLRLHVAEWAVRPMGAKCPTTSASANPAVL